MSSTTTSSAPSTSTLSTVVETISLNFDDFNESFLTCATCLYPFDTNLHRPKLLNCSHTVCTHCLERIAELPQSVNTGSFRCPICRETIPVPRGGIQSLPPSFIINQLIDLMSRQRRDLVPKCATHSSEELLFCETCDCVFCPTCSSDSRACLNHTVVPFSIAIKRMSEILLYKANQCSKNLNRAADNVRKEMDSLDANADLVVDQVNSSFQDLNKCVEHRRHELIEVVRKTRDAKRKVLQEQLGIIQSEKAKVEQECQGLQSQLEVRNISRRINDLNQKLDSSATLIEPRENAFIRYDADSSGGVMENLRKVLSEFGSLCISKTFPPLCTARALPAMVNVKCVVLLTTVDYEGQYRTSGGDPVQVLLYHDTDANGGDSPSCEDVSTGTVVPSSLRDCGDGTYQLYYTPTESGKHKMDIKIFNRSIKNSPLTIDVSAHNNPVWQFGSAAGRDEECYLMQPVRVVCNKNCWSNEANNGGQLIYILDTGNNRVRILTADGSLLRTIVGEPLAHQSAVGLALTPMQTIVTLNWRTKCVTEWSSDGREIKSFTFSEFVEPLDVAVDSKGRILVADNGAKKVFVFDRNARPQFSFPVKTSVGGVTTSANCSPTKSIIQQQNVKNKNQTNLPQQSPVQVTCVAVGIKDDIVVGGMDVQLYDHSGRFVSSLLNCSNSSNTTGSKTTSSSTNVSNNYLIGGLAVDEDGYVLATVNDRKSSYVNVCHYKGQLLYTIDSYAAKLRRPSGICIAADDHCIVADLVNNCVKKYRYK